MFDQSQIVSVTHARRAGDLHISWVSGAPSGTWHQVYAGTKLMAATKSRRVAIPIPRAGVRIHVGTVAAGEAQVNFASSLPTAPSNRVLLEWTGGMFLDPLGLRSVVGFKVYASAAPAGFGSGGFGQGGFGTGLPTVDYSRPISVIPAYTNGIVTDGFGMGGFGSGGFGSTAGNYSWESDPLTSGLWGFAVAGYDRSGNVGTISTSTITTTTAPPAPTGLSYTLAGFGVDGFGGQGFGADGFGAGPFGGGVAFGQSKAVLTWNR